MAAPNHSEPPPLLAVAIGTITMTRFIPFLLLSASLVGCSSDATMSAADEKKARDSFKGDGKFDINKVPADQREKVRAYMNMGDKGPAPSTPPANK